jgi:hypothetical protein
MPTPGPVGTVILPPLTRIGGSNQPLLRAPVDAHLSDPETT